MEKNILHYNGKSEFYATFLGKFTNRDQKSLEQVKSSLFGKVRVDGVYVESVGGSSASNQRIDIATVRKTSNIFEDTYEINGLLFNPVINKACAGEATIRLNESAENTDLQYQSTDPKTNSRFLKHLEKLDLSEKESDFFRDFPVYFNNPSFGIVEDEPGNIHRMIYADKIPIGIYHQGERYLGLMFNKETQMYELRSQKFHRIDYDTREVRIIAADDLSQSMFANFSHLQKSLPSQSEGISSSIFGTSRTKTVSVLSDDGPENSALQVIIGVGLKSHLKHMNRTHMQYQGLAFNKLTGKVGYMSVFTERQYQGLKDYTLQSRVEFLPDNPSKSKNFLLSLGNIMADADVDFFRQHILPFFANLTLGDRVMGGDVTILYPLLADGTEIGNYLVNTRTRTHNYRGLMVKDASEQPPHYYNSLHEMTGELKL